MKFQPNSFNSVQLIEQTIAISYVKREIILKNKHAIDMVPMHDTSSECALQMYEVSLKYFEILSSYRGDTIL